MKQATGASTDANRRVFQGPPIIIDDFPPITIPPSKEELMTPAEWAEQFLREVGFESRSDLLIPLANTIEDAQDVAVNKARGHHEQQPHPI
jgi:hypothetical protein